MIWQGEKNGGYSNTTEGHWGFEGPKLRVSMDISSVTSSRPESHADPAFGVAMESQLDKIPPHEF